MKKVLMIGLTRNTGGIETYIINVMRQLSKEYHFFIPYVDNIVYEQEILALGGTFIKDLPRSRKNILNYYRKWKHVFQTYRFDVVYLNDCDTVNMDMLKFAKRFKVPVRVFHAHNSSNTWTPGFLHSIAEKRNKKNIDKIATELFACSKNAGDFMFSGLPYTEIKNGIDTEKFAFSAKKRNRMRQELGLSESQKVVLFVGRFTKIKNPLFALDVIKACHQRDENYVGLFCGKGELEQDALAKVGQENMNDYIHFLGNRSDINEIYMAADLLIMPSLFEGFPFVLVEAECSGLKCICSTNVEQNTNLIGTVEYYSLESEAVEWAQSILAMQPDIQQRALAQEKIVQQGFDIVNTAQLIEKILEKNHS